MRSEQVFISYRRDDAAGYARAVYDELARQLGEQRVFIDVDDIGAGQPFSQVIEQAVGSAKVLLVLMGPRWMGPRPGRAPRLADADDFVRLEVTTALAKGMLVLPVLLDGTPMPDAKLLPPELRELTRRNAVQLDNTRFATDLQRLVSVLLPLLGDAAGADGRLTGSGNAGKTATAAVSPLAASTSRGVRWAFLAVAALLVVAGLIWSSRHTGAPPLAADTGSSTGASTASSTASGASTTPQTEASAMAARPSVNGRWQADVVYDWPNARFSEHFDFSGQGQTLQGSASYLRVRRGLLQGRIDGGWLQFETQTTEMMGDSSRTLTHHYRGRMEGELLRLTMQTEGSATAHVPIDIVAQRVSAAP